MSVTLARQVFSVSRAADFLEARALVSQTGQPKPRFGDVVLKELLDNALDACETAGVPPEIQVTVTHDQDAQLVTVADNGDGIPPGVVGRILDFATLTSDKALYRSPARGAQGNALKTIAGIPRALGVTNPVIIEARSVRHVVAVGLDAAGQVAVRHETRESPRTAGTAVTVPLPGDLDLNAAGWVRGYALVNPHAAFTVVEHGHGTEPDEPDSYKPTAGDGWRKPLPTDPTSAWWYDPAAFTRLAASLATLGDDRPIGQFIAEFRGLSSTTKRKQIAADVPRARRVSDLTDPATAEDLLESMWAASTPPNEKSLGRIPEQHYTGLLDQAYGIDRSWHKHGGIVHDGVAWHIEVTVAETTSPGNVVYATNYAVTFDDPLSHVRLTTADVFAYGAGSFLSRCDAIPDHTNNQRRAVAVHVTCAAPVHRDKGKTQIDVPPEVAGAFAKVLWQAGKELHRERRQFDRAWRRDDAAAERERRAARRPRISKKDAVFAVLPAAIEAQRGGTSLPFSAHSLFYKIRPLFLELLPGKTLNSSYCEQTLIPAYEREHGPITGMYRDPRGELHEPHSGRTIRLGTREVSVYKPPDWTFNKILVVEKAGLWPVLEASRLAHRFDMAIITSEGFGSVACRELLAAMPPGDVQIFCLHDADHSGYNIARTLGEETTRMPGHHVEMTDLGLTVDDATARGMEPEPYTRENALPAQLIPHLPESALDWFTGTEIAWDGYGKPNKWACQRVELNAFTSPGLIAYIEDGLRAHDADSKVIPPAEVIETQAADTHRELLADLVEEVAAELLDLDAITRALVAETSSHADVEPGDVEDALSDDPHQSWRAAVRGILTGRQDDEHGTLRTRITELLSQHTTGGETQP